MATSNIAFGQTLLGQGSTAGPWGVSRSTGPPLPPPPSLGKGKGKGKGKGSRVSPYSPRGGRAAASQQPVIIVSQGSSTAQCSGVPPKIMYKEPYHPWNPTRAQLLDCRDMLRGGAVPRQSGVPSHEGLQTIQEPQVDLQVERLLPHPRDPG